MASTTSPLGNAAGAAQWDARMLASMVRDNALTLVFSPAGHERDAMMRQLLMPRFGRRRIDRPIGEATVTTGVAPIIERRRARHGSRRGAEVAIRFDDWGGWPLQALREHLEGQLPLAPAENAPQTLGDLLRAIARQHDVRLLLVFDGFERHLANAPEDSPGVSEFDRQLIDLLRQPAPPARVLFLVDDGSQDRLHARYSAALPQLDRGWLRVRAQPTGPRPSVTTRAQELPTLDEAVHDASADLGAVAPGLDSAPGDGADQRPPVVQTAQLTPRTAAEPPARRWVGTLAGMALGVVIGMGFAGWFVGWHQLSRENDRPSALAPATDGRGGGAERVQPPAVAPTAAASPSVPAAAQAPAPALIEPRVVPIARAALHLGIAVDHAAARDWVDELTRMVAGPAGIGMTVVAPGTADAAMLARGDALPALRGAPGALLPLAREQVQVVVRAESGRRFLHQLRGLHMNIGEAGGARAQTAHALYRRLYGNAVPSWDVDHRDEASALRELAREGSTLDAVAVVSDRPALERLPAALRGQLRVLVLDAQHPSTAEVSRGFHMHSDPAGRGLMPQATTYLVLPAAGGVAAPAGTALACALLRARPELQRRGSSLMRGIDPGTPAPSGWVSLLHAASLMRCEADAGQTDSRTGRR